MKRSDETPLIRFLGGKNLIFTLVSLLLLCLCIYLTTKISFIFGPINILMTSIITPFLLAVIFYYMFIPLVDWLETIKVPRAIGACISLILMLAFIVIGCAFAIPIIISQIVSFTQALPGLIENFVATLQQFSTSKEFQSYYNQALIWFNDSLTELVQQLVSTLGTTIQGITSILSTISSVMFTLMTFPIFLFFLLIDGRTFKNHFLSIFPKKKREEINQLTHDINVQVGAYIKGRLLVSFLVGIYYFIGYSVIGLNYAFVLALLSGIMSLIPYLGAIIALVPAIIIACIHSWLMFIEVLIVWGFAQILDGNILGPHIIGKSLKMHPLTIIIVLIGTGSLMGIVGMIIGIPLYAIIRIIFGFFFKKYKERYNKYFGETEDGY
ncbi:AI-2E family transporter [Granulicatella sp. zg-ZJ]|uniref:AI-2E family transporter n=1 Tax=unclassified Granulicatella TaxID=2630493 RepID=UPI0013C12ABA|nr:MULTISPECIES: AI-2E family transporter [unclassified Granulicatella]MBS4749820.1 AI-2E family transporter [Carnobacteriaceae bacterium zg-ZUI78]NEW61906.1 AI-2E family transporter [Granulicatella sp. zg-ZJ]NEW66240.1 AI-2E family transporter [Granulicatella sp. zg-84]QMI85919.1 AI-2E family transporter [Carnobacteriaceae bacterium zg-84]